MQRCLCFIHTRSSKLQDNGVVHLCSMPARLLFHMLFTCGFLGCLLIVAQLSSKRNIGHFTAEQLSSKKIVVEQRGTIQREKSFDAADVGKSGMVHLGKAELLILDKVTSTDQVPRATRSTFTLLDNDEMLERHMQHYDVRRTKQCLSPTHVVTCERSCPLQFRPSFHFVCCTVQWFGRRHANRVLCQRLRFISSRRVISFPQ